MAETAKSDGIFTKLRTTGLELRGKLHEANLELKDKLNHEGLQDAKIALIHKKHEIGKFGNLFNANHRHDEEHEKATDAKRTRMAQANRYESYFPERDGNIVKWYVDGRDYFWAVSEALDQAKELIYIADWWLSPEFFLRRPPQANQDWRLDNVLKKKAEQGVKIYVIVYREVEAALACNSLHTKHALTGLCPKGSPGYGNIRVMRHPDHNVFENVADMTFYWAHHEKFIIVDYELAFIGGLDLCFGRWDVHQHPLADLHPDGVANSIWPGQDFNNNRVMDFKNVADWKENELSKAEHGRMPWHDVSMGVIGPCVYDIAEHFILRWNCIKRDKYKYDDRYDWLELRGRQEDEDLVGVQRPKHPVGEYILHPIMPLETKNLGDRGTVNAQIVRSSADWSSGILTEHSIQNAYSDIIRKAQHYVYIENQFFITATGNKQAPVHNTIGAAIVDAVLRAHEEQRKFRIIILIPAIPGFAGDLRDDAATGTRAIMHYQYRSICRGEESIFAKIRAAGVEPEKYVFFFNLRSYDRLARTAAIVDTEKETGIKYQEVQRGHAEELMSEAIHQREGETDRDREGSPSRHRQRKAAAAAEAEEEKEGGKAVAARDKFEEALAKRMKNETRKISSSVAHHAMSGTGGGETLLVEPWDEDAEEGDEVMNWIQEELYIHSKLLIADDRVVVCGSSNLNDRSQLGNHDSELSIVIEDTNLIESTMDGKPYRAGWHAATLRRYLWREHLGLLPPQALDASKDVNARPPGDEWPNDPWDRDDSYAFVEDPLGEELWKVWTEQATTNTDVFRHLFHADPDDHVKKFDDYDRYMAPRGVKPGHIFDQFLPVQDMKEKLAKVRGHLVWMPLKFLEQAEMAEKGLQVNQFTESVYT